MKTLCLLRHAKSAWDDAGLSDHDRPLAPRGIVAAGLVGRYLKEHGVRPDLVLCSTARRAVETFELLTEAMGDAPPAEYDEGLYLTGAPALLERIRTAPDSAGTLMLVAHNPDLHALGTRLAERDGSKRLRSLQEKFPTGACAILAFEAAHWRDVAPGTGRLVDFVLPRALA